MGKNSSSAPTHAFIRRFAPSRRSVDLRDRRGWGQGLRLDYQSGYTQGTVGLGVDASAYRAIKLNGGQGHSGRAGVLAPEGDGTASSASSASANVKARLSNTELKYGNNLRPYNPVFAPADTRLVPATGTGLWLTSSELEGLSLEAAHLSAAKDFNSTNSDDDFFAAYAGISADTVALVGGNYSLTDSLSVSLYGPEYKDIWRQVRPRTSPPVYAGRPTASPAATTAGATMPIRFA